MDAAHPVRTPPKKLAHPDLNEDASLVAEDQTVPSDRIEVEKQPPTGMNTAQEPHAQTEAENQKSSGISSQQLDKQIQVKKQKDMESTGDKYHRQVDSGNQQADGSNNQETQGQAMCSTQNGSTEPPTNVGNATDKEQLTNISHRREESTEQNLDFSIKEEEFLDTVHRVLEGRHQRGTRPLPVLLRGKIVDLFKLCIQVRACGGYDKATGKAKWSSISKSIGFGPECGPLLKLVYVKYLKVLENCTLVASQDKQLTSQDGNGVEQPHLLPGSRVSDKNTSKPLGKRKRSLNSQEENTDTGKHNTVTQEDMDAFIGVLGWVKRLALNPGDPRKGLALRGSKRNEDESEKYEDLARRFRTVLWKSEEVDSLGRPSRSMTRQKKRKTLEGDGVS